jgi:hypothetical protein
MSASALLAYRQSTRAAVQLTAIGCSVESGQSLDAYVIVASCASYSTSWCSRWSSGPPPVLRRSSLGALLACVRKSAIGSERVRDRHADGRAAHRHFDRKDEEEQEKLDNHFDIFLLKLKLDFEDVEWGDKEKRLFLHERVQAKCDVCHEVLRDE